MAYKILKWLSNVAKMDEYTEAENIEWTVAND
jgi:hypothetical protein